MSSWGLSPLTRSQMSWRWQSQYWGTSLPRVLPRACVARPPDPGRERDFLMTEECSQMTLNGLTPRNLTLCHPCPSGCSYRSDFQDSGLWKQKRIAIKKNCEIVWYLERSAIINIFYELLIFSHWIEEQRSFRAIMSEANVQCQESLPICYGAGLPEAAAPCPPPSPSEGAGLEVWDAGCPEQQTPVPFVQLLCLQVCSEETIETLISLNI